MSVKKSPDHVSVHVENIDDLDRRSTEEIEPEHFECYTFAVQAGGAPQGPGDKTYEQVLPLDPMRKMAMIAAIDSTVVLCHSAAQANDPANQVAAVPFPSGAILTVANGYERITGTGPVWVAATVSTVSRVSVIVNRRGQ
jgi:hypothetical protein